jgi:hypothetical protein
VTVWFVTITGSMFAYHSSETNLFLNSAAIRTWLLVMEENRKMAEGSDRKNMPVAAKK